jgi:hypothetical protein
LFGSKLCLLSVTEAPAWRCTGGHVVVRGPPVSAFSCPRLTPALSSWPWALRSQRTDDARREWPCFAYAPIRAGRSAWPATSRLPALTGPWPGADGAPDAGSCATGPGLCPWLAAGRPVRRQFCREIPPASEAADPLHLRQSHTRTCHPDSREQAANTGPLDPNAKRRATSQPVSGPTVSCRPQFGPTPYFARRQG